MNESTVQLKEAKTLPQGWRWVRFGEVCQINHSRPNGFTRPADAPTTFVPMAAVDEKLGTISKPEARSYSEVSVGYTYFQEGDVLFAKITPCMQNGKHAIARNLIDAVGFGSTEFHVIRPTTVILSEWIYFFVRQSVFLREAESYFVGAVGQQRVPEAFLDNHYIPLPPLAEQKCIATKIQELMAEVERARTACEARLEAAKALPQAYLRQVFESEEAKKWERRRLGDVCEFAYGKGLPEHDREKGNVPVYGSNGVVGYHNVFITDGPTIIIGRKGSIGETHYSHTACWPIDTTYYIDASKASCDLPWLFFLLRWLRLNVFNRATGVPGLNRNDAYSQLVHVPPLPEQKGIATELKDKMAGTENLKASIQKQLGGINALPQAILRRAFRGEL